MLGYHTVGLRLVICCQDVVIEKNPMHTVKALF